MKYDNYFRNQGLMSWQEYLLLPYAILMWTYITILWFLSMLPGLKLVEAEPEGINNPKTKDKTPVIAYIFSIIVWPLFIYSLWAEFNNCKIAHLSIWMCISAE